ncbi:hypothetical protein Franean1_1317 [Parafrankia sp. EAN1pec]|nr:hypothetical protein Franean1_1317 [Frankia sp. EAN1pec]
MVTRSAPAHREVRLRRTSEGVARIARRPQTDARAHFHEGPQPRSMWRQSHSLDHAPRARRAQEVGHAISVRRQTCGQARPIKCG